MDVASLVLLLVCPAQAPVVASDGDKARRLIQRAIDAAGGSDLFDNYTWRRSFQGNDGPYDFTSVNISASRWPQPH